MPAAARHRGFHRKPRGARRERGFRTPSGGVAARPVRAMAAMAGAALVAASVVVGTPVASAAGASPSEIRVVRSDVLLAAAPSLLNVPVNLVRDVINIPYAEIQAVDLLARAQMFSGPWFVVSATNIWGVDPGDPPRLRAITAMLVPFPALSGLYLNQNDQRGLGQQLWMLAAAELPVSEDCAFGCPPTVPTSPITGIRAVDRLLWTAAILTGQVKSPLLSNFLHIPLSDLAHGFEFSPENPDYTGSADPAGPVYPGLGIPGTTEDPKTGENLMPWDSETFTLNFFKPFHNYFDHLMADPATNPTQPLNLVELRRTVQTFLAGMVIAFDPITPGSPLCPGDCGFLPAARDYPAIVKGIGARWPGNENIDEWLTAYENGTANVATPEQIDYLVALKGHFWSFGNQPLPDDLSNTGFNPSSLAPFFHKLWTDLGLNPPPLTTPAPATGPAPSIAAPKQKPEQGDVKLDSSLQGSEGQNTGGVDAPTGGPVNKLRAFEKVSRPTLPQVGSITTSTNATDVDKKSEPAQFSDEYTPQNGPGGATRAARASGLTPPTGLNHLPPPLKGPKTPKPGDTPSQGNILKRFLPHKPGAAATNPGAATSTDAPSNRGDG